MPAEPVSRAPSRPDGVPDWTEADRAVLQGVEGALADGLELKRWWEQTDAAGGYAEPFELARTFNQPDRAVGFFDQAPLGGGWLPVMGVVQETLYDQPKQAGAEAVRREFQEFVLRYFLRVSDFRQPEAVADPGWPPPEPCLPALTWCRRPSPRRVGFGYAQLYYKRRDSGAVGKFAPADRFAIVDLRELGEVYEWVVAKVQLFNFNLTFRPFGPDALALVLPLEEENYLVLSPEFVTNRDRPTAGVLGEYGFGYALLRSPARRGVFAFGPGQFGAGFQLVTFRLRDSGAVHARLAFAVNRPQRVLDVPVDPVGWGLRLLDLMTLGLASRFLGREGGLAEGSALRLGEFDPVTAYIAAANLLTAGQAAERLCISLEQLERAFLLQHFMQHYEMLVGSLLTWRRVPDWLDREALPAGIVQGVTS
jgi:hypothetical protein